MRILLTLLVVMLASFASGHELRPSVADVNLAEGGFEVEIQLTLEVLIAEVDTELQDTNESENAGRHDRLRAMEPEALLEEFARFEENFLNNIVVKVDGATLPFTLLSVDIPAAGDVELQRDSVVVIGGTIPNESEEMIFGWGKEYGALVLRVTTVSGEAGYTEYLVPDKMSEPFSLEGVTPQSKLSVFLNYIVIGFAHIIPKGLDHILFVVGLFLLSVQMRPLLLQISAFTLAHTIALALGILGFVTVPAGIVEPLIALSIVYVGIENLLMSGLSRWRPFVVFVFGLLHGLGFASVLLEVGIVREQFVAGLIGFNVGVEIGQLTVVVVCFATFGYWFGRKPYYRRYISNPMSIFVASIAAYWFVQRAFF